MYLQYTFTFKNNISIVRYIYQNQSYSYVHKDSNLNEDTTYTWTRRFNNPYESFLGEYFKLICEYNQEEDSYKWGKPISLEIKPIPQGYSNNGMDIQAKQIDTFMTSY